MLTDYEDIGNVIFVGFEETFNVGGQHSLVAKTVPLCLRMTARTEGNKVMAVQYTSLPIHAVLSYPESIEILQDSAGHNLIRNVVKTGSSGVIR